MRPRLAILVVEQLVGGVVVGEALGLRVPVQAGLGGQGDVGEQGVGGRAMALLDVAVRLLARLDAIEEVPRVAVVQLGVAVAVARTTRLQRGFGSWNCPPRSGTISIRFMSA